MNLRQVLVVLALGCVAIAWATPARGYPHMIGHGYASCAACHVDPSGGGQLSEYGKVINDQLVRWPTLFPGNPETGEPSSTYGFMFGLVPMPPEFLNVSANLRGGAMGLASGIGTSAGVTPLAVPLLMAADARATVEVSPVVAHVSLGFGLKNVGPAMVISKDAGPDLGLVSREHWLGLKLFDDSLFVRAGRLMLPFGLRNNEHTSFVRAATRTDINTGQQHGVAVSFANDLLRADVMGIAGNFQVRPDAVRERGYSGLVEFFPMQGLGVGASSLVTWSSRDIAAGTPRLRQAHGGFVRFGPFPWVALMAEADLLVDTDTDDSATGVGAAGLLQVDLSPVQGFHFVPAVEMLQRTDGNSALPDLGVWGTFAWHVLPHTELRLDGILREAFPDGGEASATATLLLQLHLYL